MADKTIADFTRISNLSSDDIFLINHQGETNTVTLSTVNDSIKINTSQILQSGATNGQVLTYDSNLSLWKPNTPTSISEFYSLSGGYPLIETYYTPTGVKFNLQLGNNTYFNLLTAMKNPKGLTNPWLNYFTSTPKEVELFLFNAETTMYVAYLFSPTTTTIGFNSGGTNAHTITIGGKRYLENAIGTSPSNSSALTRIKLPVDSNGNLFIKIRSFDPPTYAAAIYITG